MTLEATQYLITDLALKRNLVNCAMSGPSVYAINPEEIREYPLIFVSPVGTHTIKENTTRYSFTIFYMDRLMEDSSNEDTIGSAGLETLRNLKLQLSKIEVITDIQEEVDIRLFTETERMADRVAGAYMTIWIETLNPSTCPAFFDEYGYYMGNYFELDGIEKVLDALASKEYVNRMVAAASISGMTPEEFERIMGNYVLENKFATINGEKITNRQRFNLVDQSAYTQDIQNIYQAISGATPEDYSALQEQVSANTENILTLSALTENVVSSVTEQREIIEQLQKTDSHIYILDERSTQEDVNAVVDAALNSGDTEFAKITLYYKYESQYVPLHPFYRYRPYTTKDAYFSGVEATTQVKLHLILLGLSKNSMSVDLTAQTYRLDRFVPSTDFRKINGQQIYGTGYGDFALVNSVQNTITGIWSGTQNAYNAIPQKDPKVLYVING